MSTPLIDKSFEGMLRQMRRELTLVWRRLGKSGGVPYLSRGPASDRALMVPEYWDMWQDTDSGEHLYVGNKSGGWRLYSGIASEPAGAWSMNSTSGAVITVGRTVVFTIPTVLETNEVINMQATNVGTGFGIFAPVSLVRNPTNTVVTARHMQLGSTTQQALGVVWSIVQA